ncbi:hypothetical protein AB5J72_47470 [Streptomyces sp. CG1]|uniref:aromatic-ring hydroxylase C-terminal domain-containing protein n=1 Tax=Streptomyces sp. CG1 TaxID=1287523 RepID=UPI0034E24AAD
MSFTRWAARRLRRRRVQTRFPLYEDPYGDWARLSEASDAGALPVRPDDFVAFRHTSAAPDAAELPRDALRRILGHHA